MTGRDARLHIEGEGDHALVMVHGWPDTHRLWDAQVASLRARYRCVRFDLPDYAAPAGRRPPPSLDELVDMFREAVDRVSPGRPVTLLLHDWGCVFGYEFCMRHPQRVARVIGVDVGDVPSLGRAARVHEGLLVLAYQMVLTLAWRVGGSAGDRLTRAVARGLRCPTPSAEIHARMNWPYPGFWLGSGAYRSSVQPFRPACPVLYVYGRRKPLMFHADAWLHEIGRGPRNQVTPFDTGHWVMVEQPERFNEVVRDWLCRTDVSAHAA